MEVVKCIANKKINEQSCLFARLSNYLQTLKKKSQPKKNPSRKKSYFTHFCLIGLFLDYDLFLK